MTKQEESMTEDEFYKLVAYGDFTMHDDGCGENESCKCEHRALTEKLFQQAYSAFKLTASLHEKTIEYDKLWDIANRYHEALEEIATPIYYPSADGRFYKPRDVRDIAIEALAYDLTKSEEGKNL